MQLVSINDVQCLHCSICALCAKRKAGLEESRLFYQFLQDSEEEEAWLVEKIRIVKSPDVGKDLQSIMSLLKKHQASTGLLTLLPCPVKSHPNSGDCHDHLPPGV